MVIEIRLSVADLAATRFATSALGETIAGLRLLDAAEPAAVNRPWLEWARREWAGRELAGAPARAGLLWPLVNNGLAWFPEFIMPAPRVRWPEFEDELDLLVATPTVAVRGSLRRVFGERGGWPRAAAELDGAPGAGLRRLADELRDFHDRLIAPHWDRIRPVLDADIGYRSALLASGGARRLFGDMHPELRWSRAGTLTLPDTESGLVELGPDGLVLIPTVLSWSHVSVKRATSTQTTLSYPARGAATVWQEVPGRAGQDAVTELLGAVRARLLDVLRAPASTSVLARQLAVTPGAVSQHLTVLHRAGLLRRERSGRAVLYQVSDLGLALLNGRVALHADLSRRGQRADRRAAGAVAG